MVSKFEVNERSVDIVDIFDSSGNGSYDVQIHGEYNVGSHYFEEEVKMDKEIENFKKFLNKSNVSESAKANMHKVIELSYVGFNSSQISECSKVSVTAVFNTKKALANLFTKYRNTRA